MDLYPIRLASVHPIDEVGQPFGGWGSLDPVTDRREHIAELYARHHDEAVRLAWALCRDGAVAQELAQEAFVRLYLHLGRLRDESAAPAYLRRTVVNLAYDHNRRRARERTVTGAGSARAARPDLDGGRGPVRVVDEPGDRLDLLDALAALPRRRQACVVLRYYLDLTEADTAAALGISVGTVKSQTHRALAQLRQHLGGRAVDLPIDDLAVVDRSAAHPAGHEDAHVDTPHTDIAHMDIEE